MAGSKDRVVKFPDRAGDLIRRAGNGSVSEYDRRLLAALGKMRTGLARKRRPGNKPTTGSVE